MERNRLRSTKGKTFSKFQVFYYIIQGTLYQGFNREQDYQDVLKYANDFGYVLWKSDYKRIIVLSMDGHEHVRSWLKDMARNSNQ